MHTAHVATMLQSRMRLDEAQLIVELAVLQHIYEFSDVNMSLSRCWWFMILDNDSIEGHVHGSCKLHLYRQYYSLVCDLMKANN